MKSRIRNILVGILVLCSFIVLSQISAPINAQSTINAPVGWRIFNGDGVSISLPKHYEGGSPNKDFATMKSKLQSINPDYAKKLDIIKQNASAIALFAFDFPTAKTGVPTNINITSQKISEKVSLSQYLDSAAQQLAAVYKINGQEIIKINNNSVGKIQASVVVDKGKVEQLIYVFSQPQKNTFWIVTYATSSEKFDQELPVFEQSIITFKF